MNSTVNHSWKNQGSLLVPATPASAQRGKFVLQMRIFRGLWLVGAAFFYSTATCSVFAFASSLLFRQLSRLYSSGGMACAMGLSVLSTRNHAPGSTPHQEYPTAGPMSQACPWPHGRVQGGVQGPREQSLSFALVGSLWPVRVVVVTAKRKKRPCLREGTEGWEDVKK